MQLKKIKVQIDNEWFWCDLQEHTEQGIFVFWHDMEISDKRGLTFLPHTSYTMYCYP